MNKLFVIGKDRIPGRIVLDEAGKTELTFLALPGVSGKVDMDIDIDARDVELELYGLYLSAGEDALELKFNVRHNSGGSVSRQLFKGVVSGNAATAFDGLVYVARDAQRTKAFQENHSLLLSEGAKSESRPQLEIYADDVECSHGATSGFLNADEQFYMRSRGIPEKEARRLQIISFISPLVSRLPEELQDTVYENLPVA